MKKLISAIAILIISTAAFAQPYGDYANAPTQATPYFTSLDTVANTAADTFDAPIPGVKSLVVFQHNMKRISGTTSAVTVKLYVSADKGATYGQTPVVSVTCPNSDTTFSYIFTGNPYTNYRTIITGSGTQSSSHKSWLNIR